VTTPDDCRITNSDDDLVEVRFSLAIFDINTVKKAAYRMSGRCAIDFSCESDELVCILRPLETRTDGASELGDLANAFRIEVLDQDLRRLVADETSSMRNAILAYAFSRTGLQQDD
jgi:His-Xaa-Ser system protein HxsD